MIVYVNANSEIKAVGSSSDASLTALHINDDANPFNGWSTAKICCYKVAVQDGYVTMMTPYVDSVLMEHIDMLGRQVETITPYTASKTAYIEDSKVIFRDVPAGNTSIYMTDGKGEYVPCSFERLNGDVIVSFEKRTSLATVCLSIS